MAVEKFRGILSVHQLHELTVMGVNKTEAKTNYGKEKGLARFEEPWPGIATQKMLSATFSLQENLLEITFCSLSDIPL